MDLSYILREFQSWWNRITHKENPQSETFNMGVYERIRSGVPYNKAIIEQLLAGRII